MLIRLMSASSFRRQPDLPHRPAGQRRPVRRYSLDYAGSYVDILVKRLLIHFPQLPFTFYNAGWAGDTVDRLLARYEQDVLPLSPTMMVLWVGQNDAKALCEERFAQQLHLLLQNCRRDHIKRSSFLPLPTAAIKRCARSSASTSSSGSKATSLAALTSM